MGSIETQTAPPQPDETDVPKERLGQLEITAATRLQSDEVTTDAGSGVDLPPPQAERVRDIIEQGRRRPTEAANDDDGSKRVNRAAVAARGLQQRITTVQREISSRYSHGGALSRR